MPVVDVRVFAFTFHSIIQITISPFTISDTPKPLEPIDVLQGLFSGSILGSSGYFYLPICLYKYLTGSRFEKVSDFIHLFCLRAP